MATPMYDIDRTALADLLAGWGEPGYRARQVWDGLHRRLAGPEELTDLPVRLRALLSETLRPSLVAVVEQQSDGGDTVKWLWRLHDGVTVETVLMRYARRDTVCVSSQAGCAMACGFCATGQAGFDRHLTAGEIVEQVARAWRRARDLDLDRTPPSARGAAGARSRGMNVVFMGMGEPLANYDATWAAVERIHDDLGVSARHVTVSTVGIVPGIRRLATERLPVNLAVSLHAADDGLRDELVPINRRYPLDTLVAACADYIAAKGRRLSFEWALIDGVNDRRPDAGRLAELCRRLPLPAHVNLIPLNPTPGYPVQGTPAPGVRAFRDRLRDLGVNATVRQTRGQDIEAACGQLRADHEITLAARRPQRTMTVRPPA
jgi:23S rRNA (adenine2503-C2)-methyltransferase